MDLWLVILHVLGSIAILAGFALAVWHLLVVWRGKRRWLAKIWSVVLRPCAAVMAWIAHRLPPGRLRRELLMQLARYRGS